MGEMGEIRHFKAGQVHWMSKGERERERKRSGVRDDAGT